MNNSKLLASAALFSELYNNSKKDIFEIIGDFIVGICIHKSLYSFTVSEIRRLMEVEFGFDIPEGVLKTVVNNRLSQRLNREGSNYYFPSSNVLAEDRLKYNFDNITTEQEEVFNNLIIYIGDKKQAKLSLSEVEDVKDNFFEFLLDNGFSETYSNYISAYIISNEGNDKFQQILTNIKEGLILYEGIRYSPDLNELGVWKNRLTIYLGTEYLFNSQGLNGELFRQIFYDFYNLVTEINSKTKNSIKTIELKYFSETKEEIDRFFSTAEQIKLGRINLKYNKPAMVNIVTNAADIADIASRKALFFQRLNSLGIYEDSYELNMEELRAYNLEDLGTYQELEKQSKENYKNYNETDTIFLIKIFTKINCLRRGMSNSSFEKIRYLYLSENSLARYLGHNDLLKVKEGDFTYCKEMDFVTTKFWFYLNKGLGGKGTAMPKSLNLINKAKIVISSHLQNSVSVKFDEFTRKVKKNELSDDQMKVISVELKSKITLPEKIANDVVDNSLKFLEDEDYLDNAYQEMIFKDLKLKEQEEKIKAFEERERREKEEKELKARAEEEDKAKSALINRRNLWVEDEFVKEKKENQRYLKHFFLSLLPELIIVLFSVLLTMVEEIKQMVKNFSLEHGVPYPIAFSTSIFIFITIIFLTYFIKSYILDREKVNNGWRILIRFRTLFSKEYETSRKKELEFEYEDR